MALCLAVFLSTKFVQLGVEVYGGSRRSQESMGKNFLGLETGSQLVAGLPWEVLIESWTLSSSIELFNNREMSKIFIVPLIFWDTRQSTERLVEVNSVEGISVWGLLIADSVDCAVATALVTRVSACGMVAAWLVGTRGSSLSWVESVIDCCVGSSVNFLVTALVTFLDNTIHHPLWDCPLWFWLCHELDQRFYRCI